MKMVLRVGRDKDDSRFIHANLTAYNSLDKYNENTNSSAVLSSKYNTAVQEREMADDGLDGENEEENIHDTSNRVASDSTLGYSFEQGSSTAASAEAPLVLAYQPRHRELPPPSPSTESSSDEEESGDGESDGSRTPALTHSRVEDHDDAWFNTPEDATPSDSSVLIETPAAAEPEEAAAVAKSSVSSEDVLISSPPRQASPKSLQHAPSSSPSHKRGRWLSKSQPSFAGPPPPLPPPPQPQPPPSPPPSPQPQSTAAADTSTSVLSPSKDLANGKPVSEIEPAQQTIATSGTVRGRDVTIPGLELPSPARSTQNGATSGASAVAPSRKTLGKPRSGDAPPAGRALVVSNAARPGTGTAAPDASSSTFAARTQSGTPETDSSTTAIVSAAVSSPGTVAAAAATGSPSMAMTTRLAHSSPSAMLSASCPTRNAFAPRASRSSTPSPSAGVPQELPSAPKHGLVAHSLGPDEGNAGSMRRVRGCTKKLTQNSLSDTSGGDGNLDNGGDGGEVGRAAREGVHSQLRTRSSRTQAKDGAKACGGGGGGSVAVGKSVGGGRGTRGKGKNAMRASPVVDKEGGGGGEGDGDDADDDHDEGGGGTRRLRGQMNKLKEHISGALTHLDVTERRTLRSARRTRGEANEPERLASVLADERDIGRKGASVDEDGTRHTGAEDDAVPRDTRRAQGRGTGRRSVGVTRQARAQAKTSRQPTRASEQRVGDGGVGVDGTGGTGGADEGGSIGGKDGSRPTKEAADTLRQDRTQAHEQGTDSAVIGGNKRRRLLDQDQAKDSSCGKRSWRTSPTIGEDADANDGAPATREGDVALRRGVDADRDGDGEKQSVGGKRRSQEQGRNPKRAKKAVTQARPAINKEGDGGDSDRGGIDGGGVCSRDSNAEGGGGGSGAGEKDSHIATGAQHLPMPPSQRRESPLAPDRGTESAGVGSTQGPRGQGQTSTHNTHSVVGKYGGGSGAGGSNSDSTGKGGTRTTREEDVALVHELHKEREGLSAVRNRIWQEIMTLQDEEDELRRSLGLPAPRSVPAPPPPQPQPQPCPPPVRLQIRPVAATMESDAPAELPARPLPTAPPLRPSSATPHRITARGRLPAPTLRSEKIPPPRTAERRASPLGKSEAAGKSDETDESRTLSDSSLNAATPHRNTARERPPAPTLQLEIIPPPRTAECRSASPNGSSEAAGKSDEADKSRALSNSFDDGGLGSLLLPDSPTGSAGGVSGLSDALGDEDGFDLDEVLLKSASSGGHGVADGGGSSPVTPQLASQAQRRSSGSNGRGALSADRRVGDLHGRGRDVVRGRGGGGRGAGRGGQGRGTIARGGATGRTQGIKAGREVVPTTVASSLAKPKKPTTNYTKIGQGVTVKFRGWNGTSRPRKR